VRGLIESRLVQTQMDSHGTTSLDQVTLTPTVIEYEPALVKKLAIDSKTS